MVNIQPWLIFKSIKSIEINASMAFNLVFGNNTILSCFFFLFFFFLIVDLYFLISAVIVQISILNTELLLSIGIPRKEAKAEIEIHPVTTDIATRKCSI